jgi:hypothetical protein
MKTFCRWIFQFTNSSHIVDSDIKHPNPNPHIVGPIIHDEEVEDDDSYHDTELEGVEEHKSIILHLLSQLKLGMDLTKVKY